MSIDGETQFLSKGLTLQRSTSGSDCQLAENTRDKGTYWAVPLSMEKSILRRNFEVQIAWVLPQVLYMLNPWRDQAELLVTQSLLRTKLNIFQKRLHNLDLSNKISTVSSIKAKIQDMLMNRESIVRRHRHIDYTDSRIIRQDIDITMINVFKDLKNKWI